MAAHFVDSSALVKRYVQETGTAWVRSITRRTQGTSLHISRLTAVEMTSAVARRRRDGTLSSRQASSILSRFRQHLVGRYIPLEITPELVTDAMRLANTHTLRAYDAVQLASALEVNRQRQTMGLQPATLVSADRELNAAALTEGLAVDDPNTHP